MPMRFAGPRLLLIALLAVPGCRSLAAYDPATFEPDGPTDARGEGPRDGADSRLVDGYFDTRSDAGADGLVDAADDDGPAPQPDRGPDAPAPCGYAYRRALTIDPLSVGADNSGTLPASGFPVLVQLAGDWLKTRAVDPAKGRIHTAEGRDIVFRLANSAANLDHELEVYDGSKGKLTAWVRIPSLSKQSATTFYVYYGDPCASGPTENPAKVWDADYRGVWHLGEKASGTGTAAVYRDVTSFANHCDDLVSATGKGGQIVAGQRFDGSDDYIDCPADPSLNVQNQLTLSAWIRLDSRPDKGKWRMVLTTDNTTYQMYVYGDSATKTRIGGYFRTVGFNVDLYKGTADIAPNVWTHAAITFDGDWFRAYINGQETQSKFHLGVKLRSSAGERLQLGMKDDLKGGLHWLGELDEVRVSSTSRSADWIITSFRNQNSPQTFVKLGAEQPVQL